MRANWCSSNAACRRLCTTAAWHIKTAAGHPLARPSNSPLAPQPRPASPRTAQESISAHAARGPAPVHALYSTTTPGQVESVRIFKRLRWQLQGCVEAWPPSPVLRRFEEQIGWPANQASFEATGSIVDLVPGAAEVLARAQAPPGAWQRCQSAAELEAAVASVRRRQRQWWREHGGGDGGSGDGGGSEAGGSGALPKDWLPWAYDIISIGSDECREILEGRSPDGAEVWLLRAGAVGGGGGTADAAAASGGAGRQAPGQPMAGRRDEGTGEWDAVMVTANSKQFRRRAAGALVSGPRLVAACAARVAATSPHFLCFFDQGARYWGTPGEGLPRRALPGLYAASESSLPTSIYYVFAKPAAECA